MDFAQPYTPIRFSLNIKVKKLNEKATTLFRTQLQSSNYIK